MIARAVASFGGVGFFPVAPGTAGSLVAVLLGAALCRGPFWLLPVMIVVVTVAGLLAIPRAVARDQDPGWVVIDEVAGQWIALLGLGTATPLGLLAAFLLFRLLDVTKPGPDRLGGPAAWRGRDHAGRHRRGGHRGGCADGATMGRTRETAVIDTEMQAAATAVLQTLRAQGTMLATAESCTGGLIAGALTEIAGSSDVVDRGFVTYSNAAKTAMLGVPAALIEAHGAVSAAVAQAMAEGALARSDAGITVSVTGVAGPGGGSAEKPVGTVWFGLARSGQPTLTVRHVFPGDRSAVRRATVLAALGLMDA